MTNDSNNLGKMLKRERLLAGLTLRQLSVISGVSASHLGRMERGERFPGARILKKLASPLQFIDSELFTLAGYLSAEPSTQDTSIQEFPIVSFLKEVMRRLTPKSVASWLGKRHLPRNRMRDTEPAEWPEFGEYAHRKYPNELDEDEINMIEGLIKRRRGKRYMRTMSHPAHHLRP